MSKQRVTVFSLVLLPLKFSGFVDTYYAYDFNTPANHKREYTTQPSRHDQPGINLAYLDTSAETEKTRGRLALQFGDSVDRNYAPMEKDLKYIQEAYLGRKLGEKTWLDLGIFLGNVGAESWISKNNWTYSRALNLDYVPYYSSGLRLEHSIDEKRSFQLQVLNGWQNIKENNESKAVGMQYKHLLSESLTFTYNNFFGDEEVVPSLETGRYQSRFRVYHNFIIQYLASESWQYLTALDLGHQAQQENGGVDPWYSASFTVRKVLNDTQSTALRAEYFNDRHQANVVTLTRNGFQVTGASLNFDQKIGQSTVWRTELRGFMSKDKIYTLRKAQSSHFDSFLVTSISTWF